MQESFFVSIVNGVVVAILMIGVVTMARRLGIGVAESSERKRQVGLVLLLFSAPIILISQRIHEAWITSVGSGFVVIGIWSLARSYSDKK